MSSVRFLLLGDICVQEPGSNGIRTFRSGLVRALLALLVVEGPNRVVSSHTLVDSLWDTPPRSAHSNLRTHVARLQRELGYAGLADRIVRSTRDRQGYGLRVSPTEVDLLFFRSLAAASHDHLRRGRSEEAAAGFGEALGLWRGPLGNDLPQTRRLAALAAALREERAAATEGMARATVGAGDYLDAVIQLERFLTDHPTRETAWLLLACAHYLSGNAAEAQATIRRADRAVNDLVGLELGSSLKAAEVAAIHHDDAWFRQCVANMSPRPRRA